MKTEWKEIENTNGQYLISSEGEVFSVRKNRIMRICTNNNGYKSIELVFNDGVHKEFLHRLVAKAFLPNPNNYPIVNHKDENPKNCCADNLEWCTYKYNTNYGNCISKMVANREYHCGTEHPKSKYVYQFDFSGNLVGEYESCNIAANILGLSRKSIAKACTGALKQYNGYIWSYTKEYKPKEGKELYKLSGIPVVQYDLQGNVVNVYKSANDTAQDGFFPQSVRQCCRGKLKTTGGYIWKYEGASN